MNYYTPKEIIDILHSHFLNGFVDICSDSIANNNVKANEYFTDYTRARFDQIPQDYGVFANPPYDRNFLYPFLSVLYSTATTRDIVLLVNTDASTKWYQLALRSSDYLILPAKRINFINSETGLPDTRNRYSQSILVVGRSLKIPSNFGTTLKILKD